MGLRATDYDHVYCTSANVKNRSYGMAFAKAEGRHA